MERVRVIRTNAPAIIVAHVGGLYVSKISRS